MSPPLKKHGTVSAPFTKPTKPRGQVRFHTRVAPCLTRGRADLRPVLTALLTGFDCPLESQAPCQARGDGHSFGSHCLLPTPFLALNHPEKTAGARSAPKISKRKRARKSRPFLNQMCVALTWRQVPPRWLRPERQHWQPLLRRALLLRRQPVRREAAGWSPARSDKR